MAELDTLVSREVTGDPNALRILLLRALARGDTAEEARVLAELGETRRAFFSAMVNITAFSRNLEGVERVATLPIRGGWGQADAHLVRAYLAAARGRWRAARQEFTSAESLGADYAFSHHALAAALPFLAVSRAELEELRDALMLRQGDRADWRSAGLISYPQLRQYALGLLSALLRDFDAAASHVRGLEHPPSSDTVSAPVQDLARGLRATVAWREGRAAEALSILEGLNMQVPFGGSIHSPLLARTYERYLRAELLHALGRSEEALRWYRSVVELSADGVMYLAPSHLRRAEIYERRGEHGRAMAHYARFVELWNDADPELQPAVEAVQQRLERLGREVPG